MASLEHGTKYEIYVKQFLTNKYKSIWIWNEIPINILHTLKIIPDTQLTCDDIGCDILAETFDNQYNFIQCKNYSTIGIDNTINICDLSGFYNFISENNFINGIVYYSGCLSAQITKRAKNIKYVNLPYNISESIKLCPYSYQIDAYNKLSIPGRNILTMPCGTGKTYTSYLLSAKYKNIIILSPLISTAEQLYQFYKNYYINSPTHNICVFNCMNKSKIIDLNKQNVIISTYDSVNLIYDKVNSLGDKIIIIDEYHNLSNNNLINEIDYMYKILQTNSSFLFMSATPHKKLAEYQNIFGTNEYNLSWETAINNKYICDYKFYYPNADKINVKITELKTNSILSNLELQKCTLLNKAYYLLECIKELKIKKVIVFLKSISESDEFSKILTLLNTFFTNKLVVSSIDCNTKKGERSKILSRFKNKNDSVNILCNVHILDEGIDIPECDSVYLTHPNYNPINFIQRISRCNRIKPISSGVAYIANVLIWAKDESKILNVDKLISEYLKINGDNSINNEYIRNNYIIEQNNKLAYNNDNTINNNDINIITNSKYKKFIEYLTQQEKCYVIYDSMCNIWISYNCILRILGYTDLKKNKHRFNISNDWFNSFENIFKHSDLNTIKPDYQKPTEKYINKNGVYLLLYKSNKPKAKTLLSILNTNK